MLPAYHELSSYKEECAVICADECAEECAIKKVYPTKSSVSNTGTVFEINGTKTTNKQEIAESFCNFFANVAKILKSKSILLRDFVWMRPTWENTMSQKDRFVVKEVSQAAVHKELTKLKRKKATGIDNLPPGMLKDAAPILAKPLTYVINLSLKSGTVPTDWKIAKVIPLHKSGSHSTIDNYRPISVLPTLSKILERMFYNQLMAHFEKNGLLFTHQFGFRSKRSTEQAVNLFLDHIRGEADKGKLTGAIFVDLSKAFDTVSHSVLLSKLPSYGIMNTEFQWLTDYLFNRKQIVQYQGAFSNAIPVYTGVPQGSIIGPLLFLIHFNDANRTLKHAKVITYADDTVIFTSSSDFNIIENHLNDDVQTLASWFCENELIMNLKKGKSETMLFGTSKRLNLVNGRHLNIKVDGTCINCTTSYKYLGVALDPSLNFESHFNTVYKKAAGRVNLLRRIRSSIDSATAEKIYRAMIMPVFTYCGSIVLGWSNSRLNQIRKIEERSRNIIKSKANPSTDLRIPAIECAIKKKMSTFVFDCLQDNVCDPFKSYFERKEHGQNTRNNNLAVKVPRMKTEFGRESFCVTAANVYNKVPILARQLDSRVLFRTYVNDFI